MDTTTRQPALQVQELYVSQLECIGSDYLRLPYWQMQQYGSATQTLAAMIELADCNTNTTFASQRVIAERACLNINTVRLQMRKLEELDAIVHQGRKKRRTPSYLIKSEIFMRDGRYGALPRWAARMLTKWSEKAVYSHCVSAYQLTQRLLEVEAGTIEEEYIGLKSVRKLGALLGIDKEVVCDALFWLSSPAGGEPMLIRESFGYHDMAYAVSLNPLFAVRNPNR